MPWNPEHYNVKTKPTHSEEMQNKLEPIENYGDFRDDIVDDEEHWWERHKRYIEHRKEFPYYPDKNKSHK